jgi:uncharacterized protein (TIGR02099 family)
MRFPILRLRPLALVDHPWFRRASSVALRAALLVYFLVGALVLVMRYVVLPDIGAYRADIEGALTDGLARPVTIRALAADWRGWWPRLQVRGLAIRDGAGRVALELEHVEADLAWSTLWHFEPRFARLEVLAPTLDIRRDAAGKLFVAGLEVGRQQDDGAFSDWLLAQDRIVIRDARLSWTDEQRQAPPLELSGVGFDLRNSGARHRFALVAEPPAALASRLDVRGDFKGRDLDLVEAWKGQCYAELDHADLAAWRAWIDYPVDLPSGSGGVRLWLDFAQRQWTAIAADVRLSGVDVRLGDDLPRLRLDWLDGRLQAKRDGDHWSVGARHLAFASSDATATPFDLNVAWQANDGQPGRVAIDGDRVDLAAIAALSAYLPLGAELRQRLADYGPRGHLDGLHLEFASDTGQPATFRIKAAFRDLGLQAVGVLPGFSGLDGRIDGNERSGEVELASQDAVLALPAVFADPALSLDRVDGRFSWRMDKGVADVRIERLTFANADAEGHAAGRYQGDGHSAGVIDLSARLTRASGGSVWRYMPKVVNVQVRDWLQRSIIGGSATATLRLQGDLAHFPFTDGSGIFEIKGPFRDAALDYAPGWPRFEQVSGELEFVGARMLIHGRQARLWGVQLTDIRAAIPDLAAHPTPVLEITGRAAGPTADFLRFIDESPVGDRLENVTSGMAASGPGELQLKLVMPLNHIADTAIDGRYRFAGGGLTFDPDAPPLADLQGEIRFTGDQIEARRLKATMLGSPTQIDISTSDGKAAIRAAGTFSIAALRQRYAQPWLEHLSGSSAWSGLVRVRGRSAEVRVESSLQGIASSLPAPFNKTAADTLPLLFERRPVQPPPARRNGPDTAVEGRDTVAATLGSAARLQLSRHHEQGQPVVERGLVAIGRNDARLPDRGVLLAAREAHIDLDFWRRMAASSGGEASAREAPFNQFDVTAEELVAGGQTLHAAHVAGSRDAGGRWQVDVRSREAAGLLEWDSQGAGRVSGRLSQLSLQDTGAGGRPDAVESLPAIDLTVDRFQIGQADLGQVRVKAENRNGVWAAAFEMHNDGGDLTGTGSWRYGPTQTETRAEFALTAKSVERLLTRFGYPNTIKRGTAELTGNLVWAGSPLSFDYPSLAGRLKLDAAGGQFDKLDPGVGRLLGVFSLQSLPRRISLDFRDVFSAGFAFDTIKGNFGISRGVMTTEDLQIDGPAAKVMMRGAVDLAAETQDLKVRVQPAVGQSVATGVLLVNPVAGAAAWALNKLFGNPIDKAFSFDYGVSGHWNDPKVEKLAIQGPGAETKTQGAGP